MHHLRTLLLAILTAYTLSATAQNSSSGDRSGQSMLHPTSQAMPVEAFGKIPLAFEINQGQTDPKVKFLSRATGSTLFLTRDEAVLEVEQSDGVAGIDRRAVNLTSKRVSKGSEETLTSVLRIRLSGSNPETKVIGEDELPGKRNYLLGNDPKNWHSNIPTFARVKYEEVYPGVDLVYYGNQSGRLEHDFIVKPGVDPKKIRLELEGARRLGVEADGNLVADIADNTIALQRPVIYQNVKGTRIEVPGKYVLTRNYVGFEVAAYDHSQPLVIDPVLTWSTFVSDAVMGGVNGTGIAVDGAGNIYIGGYTNISNFPTTVGAFQTTCPTMVGQCSAGYVVKLNPTGSSVSYATYLGGSSQSQAVLALAVDSQGNAVAVGYTSSLDFPITASAYQTGCGDFQPGPPPGCAGDDAFLTELNSTGSALLYSTYLGGTGFDSANSVAVDASDNAFVTGSTASHVGSQLKPFPTTVGAYQQDLADNFSCGSGDTFVARIDLTKSGSASLPYSTYLGGSCQDIAYGVATDGFGRAYVTGFTSSNDFPTTPNAFSTSCHGGTCNGSSGTSAFFAKIDTNQAGSASLPYSSFLGGNGQFDQEVGQGVAADSSGHAYVTGFTFSSDFPTTAGAYQTSCGGPMVDAFVSKFDTTSSGTGSLLYSTCMGDNEIAYSIVVDPQGNAYVAGVINSIYSPFPLLDPIETLSGSQIITKFTPDGSDLVWSTRLGGGNGVNGGGGSEQPAAALALDSAGNVFVTGYTGNSTFPTTSGSYSPTCDASKGCELNGFTAIYVAKISQADGATVALGPWSLDLGSQNQFTTGTIQDIYLRDVGNQSIAINSVVVGGANASEFAIDTAEGNPCPNPGPVTAAGECTVGITFSPTGVGLRTATVTVNDTAPGSPHVATITGTGLPVPFAGFTPTALNLGNVLVGLTSAGKNVTLTNIGGLTLNIGSIVTSGNFSQINTCGTALAPGSTCTITVRFSPTVAGVISGAITVADDAANTPQVVVLTGTGLGSVSLSPVSLSFGTVAVGTTSAAKTVTLANNQNTSISFTFAASTDYAAVGGGSTPCGSSLSARAKCTINVTFAPTQNGSINGALSVSSSSFATQLVPLSGNGTGGGASALAFSPPATTFSGQLIGTPSTPKTVTVTNVGTSSVTISGLTASADFAAAGSGTRPCNGAVVPPGKKCTFTVTFTPSVSGSVRGSVALANTSAVNPTVYNVSGAGVLPVSLSPATLNFGTVGVGGTSGPQTVTLANNQSTILTITSIVASGNYTATPSGVTPCGSTLGANSTCTFDVTFAPTTTGNISGVVTVTHGASGSPQEVKLSGAGT